MTLAPCFDIQDSAVLMGLCIGPIMQVATHLYDMVEKTNEESNQT